MKKALFKLLSILGFSFKKPKTKLGVIWLCSKNTANTIALLYILLVLYPSPLFAHSFEKSNLKIYSTQPIPHNEASKLIDEIQSRVQSSCIFNDSLMVQVYLCNSQTLYALFSPLSKDSFGITSPFTRKIFIAQADLKANTSTAFREDHRQRSFVGVATHEVGHVMINHYKGILKAFRLPAWINEGYCEYLANESSYDEKTGDEMLLLGIDDSTMSFAYYTYRRMIEYCLDHAGMDLRDLFSNPPLEQDVLERTRGWLSTRVSEHPKATEILIQIQES